MNRLILLALLPLFNACMHVDPLANENEGVGIWSLTCEKPYRFTQNCFEKKEARLQLEIDGTKVFVSSTEDETTVIFINRSYEHDFMFVTDPTSKTSARVMNIIRSQMEREGVAVQKVIPVVGLRDVHGYIMIFDSRVFSKIRSLSKSASNKKVVRDKMLRISPHT